jgi:Leucine Rich repeat
MERLDEATSSYPSSPSSEEYFMTIRGHEINADDPEYIGRMIQTEPRTNVLELVAYPLDETSRLNLVKALAQRPPLKKLKLYDNGIDGATVSDLVGCLKSGLTWLHIEENPLGDEGAIFLAEQSLDSAVGKFQLNDCEIGDTGANAFADVIRSNEGPRDLDLSSNDQISEEAAIGIIQAISFNSRLESLGLGDMSLKDDTAFAIAKVLEGNSTLCELDLRFNDIGDGGGRALSKALDTNRSLITLDLAHNDIPRHLMDEIADKIERNRQELLESQSPTIKSATSTPPEPNTPGAIDALKALLGSNAGADASAAATKTPERARLFSASAAAAEASPEPDVLNAAQALLDVLEGREKEIPLEHRDVFTHGALRALVDEYQISVKDYLPGGPTPDAANGG